MLWRSGRLAPSNRRVYRCLVVLGFLVSFVQAQETARKQARKTLAAAEETTPAPTPLAAITIVRKPGHEDGEAQMPSILACSMVLESNTG